MRDNNGGWHFADWRHAIFGPNSFRLGSSCTWIRRAWENEIIIVELVARHGSNIAEYLTDIRKIDPSAFEGIIDTLKYVLPYAAHVKAKLVVTALNHQGVITIEYQV